MGFHSASGTKIAPTSTLISPYTGNQKANIWPKLVRLETYQQLSIIFVEICEVKVG